MINKIVYAYFNFLDWYNLFKSGCLKEHDFEYILTEYNGNKMFFEHCTRCKYTQGMLEKWYEQGQE